MGRKVPFWVEIADSLEYRNVRTNVKDFFALGTGPSLGIPKRLKPGLELICTAGLPALYTHILAQRSFSTAGYYG